MLALPLTPLNLKIKNITTTSAILVWEQFLTKDLDHFEIAKQKDSELHFTIVNDRVDKFLLHYTVDNLEARTTYMLAIRAVNGKNESRDYAFAGPFTTKDGMNYNYYQWDFQKFINFEFIFIP